MKLFSRSGRPLLLVVVATAIALLSVGSAQARPESATVTRPTVTVVKRLLTKQWDLDEENSVTKVALTFRSLKLMRTRSAIPTDYVESRWVTPVAAVIDQKSVTLSPDILTGNTVRYCYLYRINYTGIYWKGDFGWRGKNRNVTTKRISSKKWRLNISARKCRTTRLTISSAISECSRLKRPKSIRN